ncbi:hypothetical protein D1013_08775 [Euzebyella marina]|uniref:Uncharacterized protein n=1 Tax=Euzebyella marina TaxID=1761453 RepID=A0A3G2L5B3_9FLAO|nr:hypothetical protein [Euzebyella marina]AYN67447.1 hypothetical protein D1013_08775 [Euzebyella marina]
MQNILSEPQFENHIRKDILNEILSDRGNFKLYDFKKAVDIMIAENGSRPNLYFLEIKYHKKSNGRLGFGSGNGVGFQPEMLRDQTDYFETNLRWILGNIESENYWFVDNTVIRNYISGGVIGEKHNNIQAKFFKEVPSVSKEKLMLLLSEWLFLQ